MPVCGRVDQYGVPFHPPHLNNSAGKVSVRRVMGGCPSAPYGIHSVLKVVGEEGTRPTKVYTAGTWKGFMKRIDLQNGRKTRSLIDCARDMGYMGPPKAIEAELYRLLDKLLPLKQGKNSWPSLDADISEHLEKVRVSANSSAGPPYWRNKSEVMETIIGEGIPHLVEVIKKGGIAQEQKTQPELFSVELKNKMDRYSIEKLDSKCRPYGCLNADQSILFSLLGQNFQEYLDTFDNGRGWNAYGFTAVRGGLNRHADWIYSCAQREYKCAVYGDDTDIVYRDQNGVLWRIAPDFSQMDGSLHQDDVRFVLKYISIKLRQKDNLDALPGVWAGILKLWLHSATDPLLLISGTKVYKKNSPHGLISGVPGTTLFSTVKSMLSWHMCFARLKERGQTPLDAAAVIAQMQQFGLTVKEGTYVPQRVPDRIVGNKITDLKFLGVQMLIEEYKGKQVVVPTLPYEDALDQILVQKDNPFERRKGQLPAARLLFDRVRGLMITYGFSIPRIRDILHQIVNDLPAEAILMQTNIEKGERPEHFLFEDYAYPDSSGFPSFNYCLSLFSDEQTETGWVQIFPTIKPKLDALKVENRFVNRELVKMRDGNYEVVVTPGNPPEMPRHRELEVPHTLPGVKNSVSKEADFHERSHINVGKRLMNLNELIYHHVQDMKVGTLGELSERVFCNQKQIMNAAKVCGFFLTGINQNDTFSMVPIQTHIKTDQSEVVKVLEENSNLIDRNLPTRRAAVALAAPAIPKVIIAQERLYIDPSFVMDLRVNMPASVRELKLNGDNVKQQFSVFVSQALRRSVRFVVIGHITRGIEQEITVELQLIYSDGKNTNRYTCATCTGRSRQAAQLAIVTNIFRQLGIPVEEDKFTKRDIPLPPEPEIRKSGMADWVQMTVREEAEERQRGWAPTVASDIPAQRIGEIATTYQHPNSGFHAIVVQDLAKLYDSGVPLEELPDRARGLYGEPTRAKLVAQMSAAQQAPQPREPPRPPLKPVPEENTISNTSKAGPPKAKVPRLDGGIDSFTPAKGFEKAKAYVPLEKAKAEIAALHPPPPVETREAMGMRMGAVPRQGIPLLGDHESPRLAALRAVEDSHPSPSDWDCGSWTE
nr:MAG: RNA-dependent RNA polymerase [Riboviria sp.]